MGPVTIPYLLQHSNNLMVFLIWHLCLRPPALLMFMVGLILKLYLPHQILIHPAGCLLFLMDRCFPPSIRPKDRFQCLFQCLTSTHSPPSLRQCLSLLMSCITIHQCPILCTMATRMAMVPILFHPMVPCYIWKLRVMPTEPCCLKTTALLTDLQHIAMGCLMEGVVEVGGAPSIVANHLAYSILRDAVKTGKPLYAWFCALSLMSILVTNVDSRTCCPIVPVIRTHRSTPTGMVQGREGIMLETALLQSTKNWPTLTFAMYVGS